MYSDNILVQGGSLAVMYLHPRSMQCTQLVAMLLELVFSWSLSDPAVYL